MFARGQDPAASTSAIEGRADGDTESRKATKPTLAERFEHGHHQHVLVSGGAATDHESRELRCAVCGGRRNRERQQRFRQRQKSRIEDLETRCQQLGAEARTLAAEKEGMAKSLATLRNILQVRDLQLVAMTGQLAQFVSPEGAAGKEGQPEASADMQEQQQQQTLAALQSLAQLEAHVAQLRAGELPGVQQQVPSTASAESQEPNLPRGGSPASSLRPRARSPDGLDQLCRVAELEELAQQSPSPAPVVKPEPAQPQPPQPRQPSPLPQTSLPLPQHFMQQQQQQQQPATLLPLRQSMQQQSMRPQPATTLLPPQQPRQLSHLPQTSLPLQQSMQQQTMQQQPQPAALLPLQQPRQPSHLPQTSLPLQQSMQQQQPVAGQPVPGSRPVSHPVTPQKALFAHLSAEFAEGTVDAALVFEGQRIPVHSSLLAARSAVFARRLAELRHSQPLFAGPRELLALDSGAPSKTMQDILLFLRHCYGCLDLAAAPDQAVLRLAILAHEYEAASLLRACDYSLAQRAASRDFAWFQELSLGGDVVDWIQLAARLGLARVAGVCETHLARYLKDNAHWRSNARLNELDQDCLLRVINKLAEL